MPEVSFTNLLVVAAIAVAAPMLVGFFPRIRVPAVVLEIIAGIAVGPSGLGWVEIDEPIEILALMGLAFLLFLAGLEIDATRLRGHLLRLAGSGFLLTVVLGVGAGAALDAGGFVESPVLVGIALMATSLGLVVPVLNDAKQADTLLGQLVIASSSVADFGAVVLLTLFFSGEDTGAGAKLVLLGGFGLLVVAAVWGSRSWADRCGSRESSHASRTRRQRSGSASPCSSWSRSLRSPNSSVLKRSSAPSWQAPSSTWSTVTQ
jgi:Kef-type K+ transport system membrane component KefB